MKEETQLTMSSKQPVEGDPAAALGTRPPPLPPNVGNAHNSEEGLFPTFGKDFVPMEKNLTPFSIVDALLKHPGRVICEIMKGNPGRMGIALFVIAAVCMAGYGLIMGSFSGGAQYWAVPVKLTVGTFLSGLICLPSLYILTSLSGGGQSLSESIGLLLVSLALSGILLVGFAPIAWIFSQSTNTVAFMGGMHVLFWMCGIYFGLRLLITSFSFLNKRRTGVLTFWSVIFIVVAFQMSTALRPLVGGFRDYELQGKKFFLAHWGECLSGKYPAAGARER